MLTDVLGVERRDGDATPVHLPGENFITEEPVAKDATVAVGTVEALSAGDVWEITQDRVHGIVLFLHVVEVTSVLVDLKRADHSLEKQECVEIFMLP